ncbi:mitochondrial carrier [Rhizopus microsporus var. microsporus]|uniref:Mitochondrial carrier n=2 Tax=Rhizopus microsporus TaxID=58291 RepID=A0A2G4SF57_RHIZD|nr:mitochondrial carrier [Rhizopus microsporus ATCC 52813]ORE01252.1 mitochondrial carrier [Rhizopus microsporus var. microsporus]PHZ07410.1 mitochondrial carrier [Rhizopus microsporus ATCC 52813]
MEEKKIVSFEEYKLPPLGHAVSGAVGSTIANLFIYPLDISTTRLQLKQDKEENEGILSTIKSIYQKEGGIKGLYAGLGSDTLATVLSSFIYFYCYTALRNVQEKLNTRMGKPNAQLNIAQELFLGAEAALISRFFTTPVSNVTTRLQTNGGNGGFRATAMSVFDQKGITGFWTGYRASMVLVSNPSITYFVFEKLKAFYLQTKKKSSLSSFEVFLFSALSKSIATMITYPFIFLRTRMVSGKNDREKSEDEKVKTKGMVETLKEVVEKDGMIGLYKGMKAQLIKGFFNQGIMYMIKDYVATYLTLVFYHSYKLKMKAKLGV